MHGEERGRDEWEGERVDGCLGRKGWRDVWGEKGEVCGEERGCVEGEVEYVGARHYDLVLIVSVGLHADTHRHKPSAY